MRIEGVTFIDHAVRRMGKDEFIALHIDVVWLDRKKTDRRRMLADAYTAMTGE